MSDETKIPSFYDDQPTAVILTDAEVSLHRLERYVREGKTLGHGQYACIEHLAALLVAREDVTMADITIMGDLVRQARRALGFMPAVQQKEVG